MPKVSKRSRDYWRSRFTQLEKSTHEYSQSVYNEIEPAFTQAQMEIQKEIDAWYARFAANNGVSLTDAKRMLTAGELSELKWDVNQYIKYGRENAVNGKWVKELENASAKFHITRLEAIKLRTQQALEKAFGNQLDNVDKMAHKILTDNYYHSIFEVQKGFNIGWRVGQIDQRQLDKLVVKPWAADGKNFSDRIWQQKRQAVSQLHNELTRMLIQGKAPDEAIKAMTQFVDKNVKNAKSAAARLVQTEAAYFQSVSQKEAFNDLDVEEFEIIATLDSHTSEFCQEMDGKHFPMSIYEAGVTAPPFHPRCRSVSAPYFEDNYGGMRVARGEDGKTYYVPDDTTYPEWKKSMVDGKTDLTKADDGGIIKETPRNKFAAFVDSQAGFTDDFKNKLKAAFANGTPAAREAYLKYLTQDVIGDTAYKNGACFIPKENKIFFDVATLNKDPRGAATIYFHEFGHLIDFRARGSGIRVSMDNPTYVKAIHKDFNDLIQNFMKANSYSEEMAFAYFRREIKRQSVLTNQISDLFGGLSQNKCKGRYSHDNGYWNDGSLAREAFAHMFECQFDKERYNLMQQYFPTALAEFEKMLGGLV